jgi:hypothetical protein
MGVLDTPEMRALRDRLLRRPSVEMLKVWNGNEAPTLEQLVEAAPPVGGVWALIRDMERRDTQRRD